MLCGGPEADQSMLRCEQFQFKTQLHIEERMMPVDATGSRNYKRLGDENKHFAEVGLHSKKRSNAEVCLEARTSKALTFATRSCSF